MSQGKLNDAARRKGTVRDYHPIEELLPPHWSEGIVSANGIRQHYYRTRGDKPPVVLLHGFLGGALSWLRTARSLEGDYDVVMVDARGHGLSDRIESSYTQELLTEDAAGAIRVLGLAPVHLLGFSQGGTTAIHVTDAHPELVRSLIVAGAGENENVNTDLTQSAGYKAWYDSYLSWLEGLKTQTHVERMLSALSQLPPGAPLPPEQEYVPWVEDCARLDLDLVRLGATMWSDLGQRVQQASQALERVTCPVLIMKSAFFPQPAAPRRVTEEASERPNVRIVRFENTGHLIQREQFQPFIEILQEFLKGH